MLSVVLSNTSNAGFHSVRTRIHPLSTLLIHRHSLSLGHYHHHSRTRSAIIKAGSGCINGYGSALRPVPAFVSTDPLSHFPSIGMLRKHPLSTSENNKVHEKGQHNHMDKNAHECGNRQSHNNHEHGHSHAFPLFGHSHSHQEGHARDAEKIIAALKGSGLCCWLTVLSESEGQFRGSRKLHHLGWTFHQCCSNRSEGVCWMVLALCIPFCRCRALSKW
jgi:hypothetical protein